MTFHYFDPSAWVKRHFQEVGIDVVNRLLRTAEAAACCRLGFVEMIATIAGKGHGESLDPHVVQSILENVRDDFTRFRIISVDDLRIKEAEELAVRYRMRTLDAIHLACALSLGSSGETVMVSSDLELLTAAASEGLRTSNPAAVGAEPRVP
jgi:uncharacterized protein